MSHVYIHGFPGFPNRIQLAFSTQGEISIFAKICKRTTTKRVQHKLWRARNYRTVRKKIDDELHSILPRKQCRGSGVFTLDAPGSVLEHRDCVDWNRLVAMIQQEIQDNDESDDEYVNSDEDAVDDTESSSSDDESSSDDAESSSSDDADDADDDVESSSDAIHDNRQPLNTRTLRSDTKRMNASQSRQRPANIKKLRRSTKRKYNHSSGDEDELWEPLPVSKPYDIISERVVDGVKYYTIAASIVSCTKSDFECRRNQGYQSLHEPVWVFDRTLTEDVAVVHWMESEIPAIHVE